MGEAPAALCRFHNRRIKIRGRQTCDELVVVLSPLSPADKGPPPRQLREGEGGIDLLTLGLASPAAIVTARSLGGAMSVVRGCGRGG